MPIKIGQKRRWKHLEDSLFTVINYIGSDGILDVEWYVIKYEDGRKENITLNKLLSESVLYE